MLKNVSLLALGFNSEDILLINNILDNEGYQTSINNTLLAEATESEKQDNLYQVALVKLSNSMKNNQDTLSGLKSAFPLLPIILITDQKIEKSEPLFIDKHVLDIRSFKPAVLTARSIIRELDFQHHRTLFQQSSEQIKSEKSRLESLIQNSEDGFALIYDGNYISINNAYKRIFHIPDKEDLAGMPVTEFTMTEVNHLNGTAQKSLNISLDALPNNETTTVNIQTRDHNSFVTTLYKSQCKVKGQNCIQLLIHNPDPKASFDQEFTDLRSHDVETGIFNKSFIIEYVTKELNTEQPEGGFAFILLDDFRSICEENSIDYTDNVLKSVAADIASILDDTDVFARFGDHVFTLFSPKSERTEFLLICENVLANINNMLFGEDERYTKLSLSIGISFITESISTAQQLIAQADKACDTANLQGGNQIHVYDSIATPLKVLEDEAKSVQLIQTALEQDRLQTMYQPIVDLASETTENYAVLLRILSFENKHIPPDHFLHAAQQSGLIRELDKWVLTNIIQQIRQAERQGINRRFFLNLSQAAYMDDSFIRTLITNTKFYDIDTSMIVFQVNLSETLTNSAALKKFISLIKLETNCLIALDQVGFSEITDEVLQAYSVDFIKIDGSFTQQIINDQESQELFKEILEVTHRNNTRTIAKSVEDANTMALLWNLGIDAVQGYFLQKPSDQMSFDFELK